MELGSVIVAAVAIAICILPFVMLNKSKKKREQELWQALSNFAAQNNCKISQHEIFGNFAIGIDESQNAVFYFRKFNNVESLQMVKLSEIKDCKVNNINRTFKNKDGIQRVIDRLELSFTPSDKDKPGVILEFFNADLCMQLYGELLSIKKWSQLINSRLQTKM